LTEIAFEKASLGIFTRAEVACWVGGSPHRQFNLIKRALAGGEVHPCAAGSLLFGDELSAHHPPNLRMRLPWVVAREEQPYVATLAGAGYHDGDVVTLGGNPDDKAVE